MKTIIAGSRSIPYATCVAQAIQESGFEITEVVSGRCYQGIDALGELWAQCNNIPVKVFPANWTKFGKMAGPIRNAEMADYADALIAVWDGKSPGTRSMIKLAKFGGLKVYVKKVDL